MTQDQALAILKTGAHVFLTGEAGSGKTHIINQYTAYLREHEIDFAVTASTGIAATHIHGMTLHSWSGIGIQSALDDEALKHIAENKYVAKRIKKAQVLIIDEISMLDGKILTLVEQVCRRVRKLRRLFGGLQVVLVGDFFQLPPVSGKDKKGVEFAFDAEVWQALQPTACYLSEQHRQEDSTFLAILSAIRRNEFDEGHFKSMSERMITVGELPDNMTRLYSHNVSVDSLNAAALKRLPGKVHTYVMAARGPEALTSALIRGCLSPERLELKEGATVMFTKNNQSAGYVNGTLGTVIGFTTDKKYPMVKTTDGMKIETAPMEWTIAEGDEVFAKITQLPLRLAWAMTIHKSQGASLDAAVMDLSQTFEYGQGYVALSRVRTLSGVHLLGVNARAFQVHPLVLEQDERFRQASLRAEEAYGQLSGERISELERNFVTVCGGKQKRVKKFKKPKKDQGVAAADGFATLRAKHPQAYRPWIPDEETQLKKMYERGQQLKEICEKLGRQPGGIRSRLKKLGLIPV
ncbi:MAG: PIF1 family DEAD/DEAH box helicase [Candidatus Moranbacteria bacterium]|nr:PIF1 family DEAD/DEAH box helicase [Candidatus Moranbacteria bacterium]